MTVISSYDALQIRLLTFFYYFLTFIIFIVKLRSVNFFSKRILDTGDDYNITLDLDSIMCLLQNLCTYFDLFKIIYVVEVNTRCILLKHVCFYCQV